jgi:hypothetical protein
MADKKTYTSFELKQASGKKTDVRGIEAGEETLPKGKETIKIADAIAAYVNAAAQESQYKEQKDEHASIIREFVNNVRGYFNKQGQYVKTFRVFGNKLKKLLYAVDVAHQDRFNPPSNKEDIESIKKLLGQGNFDQIFEENITISIKKTVSDNDVMRRELSKLLIEKLGPEGLKRYFERDAVYVVKKGLAEKINKFPEEIQKIIKENLKQTSDSIKDVSETIS